VINAATGAPGCSWPGRRVGGVVRENDGYKPGMASQQPRQKRSRNPLPEERTAGTDNAEEQTSQVLSDSDSRQADRNSAPGTVVEHRRSAETVEPVDGP
jgi:hypothetical protein